MNDDLSRVFAEITARLETLHSISVEGQHRDNSADIHQVLARQLWLGVVELRAKLRSMSALNEGGGQ